MTTSKQNPETLAELIRRHGRLRGDTPALTERDRSVTYGELDARSNQVAHALADEGICPGDRVAFLDKNSIEYFEVLFGCAKLGAVDVSLNWRLAPRELAEILEDSKATVLVAHAEFSDAVDDCASRVPSLRSIVVIGEHSSGVSYDDWLRSQPSDDVVRGVDEGDGVVIQLYTSGTTGVPKGVMLTESNLYSLVSQGGTALDLDPSSVNLVPMPLFHIGGSGYALIGVHAGCHTVLMRELDPGVMLQTMQDQSVTNAFAVPAVLQFMVSDPAIVDRDLSSLRTVTYGASPISRAVLDRAMEALQCDFIQVYGLTETTGTVTLLSASDHRDPDGQRLRSAGRPVAGATVRILSPGGDELAVGEVGEICIRSPQNMLGYWRKPAETAAALSDDGWLRTGDAGYVDDGGYLYIHDRIKDMIISGGENVYPAEVESVLMSDAAVADVAVIGVPSDRWGETVKALVVPASEAATEQAIISRARASLAHFKCPTSVDFVESLPRNPSGKILKKELRAPYWKGRERHVG